MSSLACTRRTARSPRRPRRRRPTRRRAGAPRRRPRRRTRSLRSRGRARRSRWRAGSRRSRRTWHICASSVRARARARAPAVARSKRRRALHHAAAHRSHGPVAQPRASSALWHADHEAVELASKRHRELEQAIEHERDEKRARIASTAALAREVESLSARFSSLAAAHAAQATHVAALQAALEAGRQEAAPTETGFFDLFFDGDGAERLGETLGLETLADEGTPADVSTAACPNANGGLPPDEDDDNDTDEPSAFEPALEPVSPSKTAARFAPIAHAAREAGGTSAPPAVWRLTPVARDYAPVTPAAKPRDTETAPPDAGAYRLRSGTKRAVGSDSQSDSARRRLFDCDFSRGGGGYNVAEDLFDNAMSQ